MKKFIIRSLLGILLISSLMANLLLIRYTILVYKSYKLASVFPHNLNKFRDENKAISKNNNKELIIFFGDSRIEEWDLQKISSDQYFFLNRGVGGETTAQLKLRLQQDVISLQPKIVVIQAGINDLVAIGLASAREKKIKSQSLGNIQNIIDTLLENNIQVILTTIIPPAEPSLARKIVWSPSIDQAVHEFNDYWLTATQQDGLTILNTEDALKNQDGSWKKNVNRDTLHLTQEAYIYLNQSLEKLINQGKQK